MEVSDFASVEVVQVVLVEAKSAHVVLAVEELGHAEMAFDWVLVVVAFVAVAFELE